MKTYIWKFPKNKKSQTIRLTVTDSKGNKTIGHRILFIFNSKK